MIPGITVVIPSIPPRERMRRRALVSVNAQTLKPYDVIVEFDHRHEGAGPTRTRGLRKVQTEWTAFLDDDDILYPHHLETLMQVHEDTGASICWAWFDGNTIWDHECMTLQHPHNCHRHKDFDFEQPHLFGITYMVRTELAQQCEFPPPERGDASNEDYDFLLQLRDLTKPEDWGHTDVVTWRYNWHGWEAEGAQANTSGQGWRW